MCTYPYGTARVVFVKYGPKRRGDGWAALCIYMEQMQIFRKYRLRIECICVYYCIFRGTVVQQIAFTYFHHVRHDIKIA